MKLVLRGCDPCECPDDAYGAKKHRAACIHQTINHALQNRAISDKGGVLGIEDVQRFVTAMIFTGSVGPTVHESYKNAIEERDLDYVPRIELACTRLTSLDMMGRLDADGKKYMKEMIDFVNSMHRCYRNGLEIEVAT